MLYFMTVYPICQRLRYNLNRNVHNLDLDLDLSNGSRSSVNMRIER